MTRVHATFSVAQARQAVYAAACKEWQLTAGEIPWEVRFIRTEINPGHFHYRWFLMKSQYSSEIVEYEVIQKKFGDCWYILYISINQREITSMEYQVKVNAVTGAPFTHEVAVVAGDFVVMSKFESWKAPLFPVTKFWVNDGWNWYLPEWGSKLGEKNHAPCVALLQNATFFADNVGQEVTFFGLTYTVLKAEDFVGKLPYHKPQFDWQEGQEEPTGDDRLLAIAKSLALHHARLKVRKNFMIWDLMNYGKERGQVMLDYALPKAREVVAAEFPEVDIDDVIRRFRAGERVFIDCQEAQAAARYATIAPISTDPEKVGQPMGGINYYNTSLVYCGNKDAFWVNTGASKGKPCPCCGTTYQFYRGANAWPEYTVSTPNHTYILVAKLPFDDQKRYSRDVKFRTVRFPLTK